MVVQGGGTESDSDARCATHPNQCSRELVWCRVNHGHVNEVVAVVTDASGIRVEPPAEFIDDYIIFEVLASRCMDVDHDDPQEKRYNI